MTAALRDIRDLSTEQADLLWCMRLWVRGTSLATPVSAQLEQVAARLDAADAAHFIAGFMDALNRGIGRSIEIGCLRCSGVGADEALLLDALGLAQERRTFEALLALRDLVGPEAARAAVQNAEGIGLALARAGRFLPAPGSGAGGLDLAGWRTTAAS